MLKRNKKGFGGVASTLIMFIAIISVTTGLVIALKNYTLDTQESISFQNKVVSNQLKTAIEITNIFHNASEDMTYVYVKNIGQTNLRTNEFDFFLDEVFITNYNVNNAANVSESMDMLFPSSTAVFSVDKALASGTHKVKMVSGYGGAGDTDYFNK
jgi:archaellum component FlaF (FlaF/FlaG flagellin family)